MATHDEISVNPEQAGELAAPIIAAVQAPLLKPLASGVSISATPAVEMADCFKVGDGVYTYRDPDFNRWLPQTFPAVRVGNASTFELAEGLTFQGIVRMHIGDFPDELEKALTKQGKCWSPKQIDELIRNCKKGDNPLKLRTDGYTNVFFVEVNGDVFAVYARRLSGGWSVNVHRFENSYRWDVGDRVSFRN